MADKIAQNPFLHEINQALNTGKCLKSLAQYSKNLTESLFLPKFADYVKNLGEKLEIYDLQLKQSKQAANRSENAGNTSVRDEIIHDLNVLWNIFSRAGSRKCFCPLFLKLFKTICADNGCLLVFLRNCLNSHDQFVAFQSYKVFCKVYKCFPDLIQCIQFEELLKISLSDDGANCGQWLGIYTAEIIKAFFIEMNSSKELSTLSQHSPKSERHASCCFLDNENSNEIWTEDIKVTLCSYWLKLTNHYSAKLLNNKDEFLCDVHGDGFDHFQQILTTLLSFGRTFIQTCDFFLASKKLADMNVHSEKASPEISGNETLTINSDDMDSSSEETLESFKQDDYTWILFEEIIVQLIKIDHKKCLLHFSRTVFQFMNDFAGAIAEHCLGGGSTSLSYQETQRVVRICGNLVEHCNMLLDTIPTVMGKVHFGGQDDSGEQEMSDVKSQSYDQVCLRKVLLLVIKLILPTCHAQNDSSKIIQWQALKQPLESWLSFVTEMSHPKSQPVAVWLVELFCDQDDELIYLSLCLLQLHQKLFCVISSQPVPSWASYIQKSLNPHVIFMEFLTSVSYDHSLLLDFLISNETHFLQYFYNYLCYLANDWLGFKETVDERQHLSKEDKLKMLCPVQVPEGVSDGFLSAGTKLFPGTVKSFSIDAGDSENCDDGGLDQGGSYSDWYDGCTDSDCDTVGDNDGNNINSAVVGCGSGDKIGNGDSENDLYEKSDDDHDDGDDNDGDINNDGSDDSENDVLLSNINNLQQTLTCLIRLRYSIERMSLKGLFPYPVTTLVKVMEYIETLYEGDG